MKQKQNKLKIGPRCKRGDRDHGSLTAELKSGLVRVVKYGKVIQCDNPAHNNTYFVTFFPSVRPTCLIPLVVGAPPAQANPYRV